MVNYNVLYLDFAPVQLYIYLIISFTRKKTSSVVAYFASIPVNPFSFDF